MTRWLGAFLFTQIVEMPIYMVALRRSGVAGGLPKLALLAFGASAITHPFVWFLFPRLVQGYWLMVACAEAFAVLAEAAYFTYFDLRRALVWALAANAASVALGFSSRWLFGFP